PQQAELLVAHALFVLDANERVNLTAIREPAEAIRLHIVDSLLALPEVVAAPSGSLIDMGTGAGYPGVPLAICSGRAATLLDSVGKKVKVLDEFVQQQLLSSQLKPVHLRAEEYATNHRGEYAVVVARAVSELPALIELARPFLKKGGVFVALKARPDDIERERGDRVAAQVGMERIGARTTSVPGGDDRREILTFRVSGGSSVALPRRVGLAQSKPLA
ncbi:MAG: 16S rRNA (guanine(527)-N(7))-methyltransferase RsmG, partial [Actinobacteria bacterium]